MGASPRLDGSRSCHILESGCGPWPRLQGEGLRLLRRWSGIGQANVPSPGPLQARCIDTHPRCVYSTRSMHFNASVGGNMSDNASQPTTSSGNIDFRTSPDRYRHWKLAVRRRGRRRSPWTWTRTPALFEGYQLKLNSYDLGVDIELADAVQRLRFEHPEVKVGDRHVRARTGCSAPAPTSACSPASTHAHKVNFCKFTNETRNGIEDCVGELRPAFICAVQRHGGRRRLRAGARLRPDHPRRRRQLGRVAARGAAARGAARHRRPDARRRQAQGAPRPGRRRSAPSRKASRASAPSQWRLVDEVGAELEVRGRRIVRQGIGRRLEAHRQRARASR